jgi:hypothetical protein
MTMIMLEVLLGLAFLSAGGQKLVGAKSMTVVMADAIATRIRDGMRLSGLTGAIWREYV